MQRSRLLGMAMALGAALAISGCGSDEDEGENAAVGACRTFANTWCDHALGCLRDLGTVPPAEYDAQLSSCNDVAQEHCGRAVATSSSYDQCLVDISNMACSSWDVPESELNMVSIPETCHNVILIE